MENLYLIILMVRASLEAFPSAMRIAVCIIIIAMLSLQILIKDEGVFRTQGKRSNKIIGSFILLIISMIVTSLINLNISESFSDLLKYITAFACVYISYSIAKADNDFFGKLNKVVIYSAIIPMAYGGMQILTGTGMKSLEYEEVRVNSFFAHPAQYAMYLVIVEAAILYVLLLEKKKSVFLFLELLMVLINIFYSYARVAWIGLVVIALLITLYTKNKKNSILLLLCGIIVGGYAWDIVKDRFLLLLGESATTNSMVIRIIYWEQLLELWTQKICFGYGVGTVNLHIGNDAHNEYVRSLFETGLVGTCIFLYQNLQIVLYTFGERKKEIRLVGILFITFLLMSFTDNIFGSLVVMMYLWSYLGAVLGRENK